ncbi:MAG: hypothetical protein DWQ34_06595 [Planctomycetota bacterium]|nr:MAG: hypothetical protein DWQ34_06595 [Planctomycetota bacterium]REK25036.1 MAG: hypothetical protein DWQ41_12745 [Planctomycetota bacterium]REK28100.1 MAG: hypothetical protein DWQ45_25070 [Planctomycetota bacterium]
MAIGWVDPAAANAAEPVAAGWNLRAIAVAGVLLAVGYELRSRREPKTSRPRSRRSLIRSGMRGWPHPLEDDAFPVFWRHAFEPVRLGPLVRTCDLRNAGTGGDQDAIDDLFPLLHHA